MKQTFLIGTLLCLSMILAACGAQATPLPTTAPAATQASAATERPTLTAMPAATETTEPTQAVASSGDSGSAYDYGYGSNATPSGSGVPVTGGDAIHSQDGPLGTMLVDSSGKTLYIFLKDTQNANTSACTGKCADNWPALTTANAGERVDASLLGSFQRADGTSQVTYNGWPLYYFALDLNPGDANGQGFSGNWYVVSPAGEAIK